jgi:hypothetical protein
MGTLLEKLGMYIFIIDELITYSSFLLDASAVTKILISLNIVIP